MSRLPVAPLPPGASTLSSASHRSASDGSLALTPRAAAELRHFCHTHLELGAAPGVQASEAASAPHSGKRARDQPRTDASSSPPRTRRTALLPPPLDAARASCASDSPHVHDALQSALLTHTGAVSSSQLIASLVLAASCTPSRIRTAPHDHLASTSHDAGAAAAPAAAPAAAAARSGPSPAAAASSRVPLSTWSLDAAHSSSSAHGAPRSSSSSHAAAGAWRSVSPPGLVALAVALVSYACSVSHPLTASSALSSIAASGLAIPPTIACLPAFHAAVADACAEAQPGASASSHAYEHLAAPPGAAAAWPAAAAAPAAGSSSSADDDMMQVYFAIRRLLAAGVDIGGDTASLLTALARDPCCARALIRVCAAPAGLAPVLAFASHVSVSPAASSSLSSAASAAQAVALHAHAHPHLAPPALLEAALSDTHFPTHLFHALDDLRRRLPGAEPAASPASAAASFDADDPSSDECSRGECAERGAPSAAAPRRVSPRDAPAAAAAAAAPRTSMPAASPAAAAAPSAHGGGTDWHAVRGLAARISPQRWCMHRCCGHTQCADIDALLAHDDARHATTGCGHCPLLFVALYEHPDATELHRVVRKKLRSRK